MLPMQKDHQKKTPCNAAKALQDKTPLNAKRELVLTSS
jgi:hypothetical protein